MGILTDALGKSELFDSVAGLAKPSTTLEPVLNKYAKLLQTGGEAATFPSSKTFEDIAPSGTTRDISGETPVEDVILGGESSDIIVSGDTDVRLKVRPLNDKVVYGDNDPTTNIMSILYETNGLLFPYKPTITLNQAINWDPLALIHTNFDINAYQRTPSVSVSVAAPFTAQTQREGEYLMAVLHFLKVVSKSYYGVSAAEEGTAGIPPPVLKLHGFGTTAFSNVPVILKNYSYTFDDQVDYTLFFAKNDESAYLPAKLQITMEFALQFSVTEQREYFSLNEFRSGKLKGFY